MKISEDATKALATKARIDLILVGDPEEILLGLLNNEIGTQIGNLGETVSVKLTSDELHTLTETTGSSISHVFLNRNVQKVPPEQASEEA